MGYLNGFNRVAWSYDFLARIVFGKSIRKAQIQWLDSIPKDSVILIIGGGTGWILKPILEIAKPDKIIYLEASSKMIQKAKKKCQDERIEFIHGTEQDVDFNADVVCTFFFLDMFDEQAGFQVMKRLMATSCKNWMFCDFDPEIQISGEWWKRKFLSLMYWFFRNTSKIEARRLAQFDKMFEELGWKFIAEKKFYKQMIVSRHYQL